MAVRVSCAVGEHRAKKIHCWEVSDQGKTVRQLTSLMCRCRHAELRGHGEQMFARGMSVLRPQLRECPRCLDAVAAVDPRIGNQCGKCEW